MSKPETNEAGVVEELDRWVELFNNGEFFQAHEVLEDAWRAAAEPGKTFLKGLIHASVALYQYQRGNGHGARVKYQSCIRYLTPFAPIHAGLDVADLLRQLERFFAPLLALPPGSPPPIPVDPFPNAHWKVVAGDIFFDTE